MNSRTTTPPAATPKPEPQHESKSTDVRKQMAAVIASGLVAVHGIDAGGIEPFTLAQKALGFADAICALVDAPELEQDEDGDDIPPGKIGD